MRTMIKRTKKPKPKAESDNKRKQAKIEKEILKAKMGTSLRHKFKSSPTQAIVDNEEEGVVDGKKRRKKLQRSGSVKHLKLDHLYCNNIISERQRIDPRELDSTNSNPSLKSGSSMSEEYDFSDSENSEEEIKRDKFPMADPVQEMQYEETKEDEPFPVADQDLKIVLEEDTD